MQILVYPIPTFLLFLRRKQGSPLSLILRITEWTEQKNWYSTPMKKSYKIAEKVGYQDANYFSYVFKKEIRRFPHSNTELLREKGKKRKVKKRYRIYVFNIQTIILSVLMAISLVTIIVMGLLLYHRFKLALEKQQWTTRKQTVEGTVDRLNADLLDIRQIL